MLTFTTTPRDGQELASTVRLLAHDAYHAIRDSAGPDLRDVVRRIALLQRELEDSGQASSDLSRWLTSLKRQVRTVLETVTAAEAETTPNWAAPAAPLRRFMEAAGSRS